MTDTRKQHQIGQVTGVDEPETYHADYRLGVILGIYALVIIPIVILSYGLGQNYNWSTNFTVIVFSGTLLIFTLFYATSTLGMTVKILRSILNFIYKMYVANRQFKAFVLQLEADHPPEPPQPTINMIERPMLADSQMDTRTQLTNYLKFLYERDDNGDYININPDGRIIGQVPWSVRARQIREADAMTWFSLISYKRDYPLIYYNKEKRGWYLNIENYPLLQNVMKSFQNTYVPPKMIGMSQTKDVEDGEWSELPD